MSTYAQKLKLHSPGGMNVTFGSNSLVAYESNKTGVPNPPKPSSTQLTLSSCWVVPYAVLNNASYPIISDELSDK